MYSNNKANINLEISALQSSKMSPNWFFSRLWDERDEKKDDSSLSHDSSSSTFFLVLTNMPSSHYTPIMPQQLLSLVICGLHSTDKSQYPLLSVYLKTFSRLSLPTQSHQAKRFPSSSDVDSRRPRAVSEAVGRGSMPLWLWRSHQVVNLRKS